MKYLRVHENQVHGIVPDWKGAQDLFLAGLLFKSGSDKGSEQVTLGFIQLDFENLHAGILHNLLGQFVPHCSSCVKTLS